MVGKPVEKSGGVPLWLLRASLEPISQQRLHESAELAARLEQPHLHPAAHVFVNVEAHLHVVRTAVLCRWPSDLLRPEPSIPVSHEQLKLLLNGQELGRAFSWLGVQVAPGDGDARMRKRGVYYVNRRSTVHSVRSMGVPEPVRRHLAPDTHPPCRLLNNSQNLGPVQVPATFARRDHRQIVISTGPERHKVIRQRS